MIKRLHWGCGSNPVPGWINSDRRNLTGVDIVCDIRDGLPLESDSIDYAVSIHALQEVPYSDLISVLLGIARQLAIPLRHHAPKIRYCGDIYGQTGEGLLLAEAISVDRLIEILTALPPGVTELACHPGLDDKLRSAYRRQRAEEVTVLCDPRVRATIIAGGIELRSFGDLALRARLC